MSDLSRVRYDVSLHPPKRIPSHEVGLWRMWWNGPAECYPDFPRLPRMVIVGSDFRHVDGRSSDLKQHQVFGGKLTALAVGLVVYQAPLELGGHMGLVSRIEDNEQGACFVARCIPEGSNFESENPLPLAEFRRVAGNSGMVRVWCASESLEIPIPPAVWGSLRNWLTHYLFPR